MRKKANIFEGIKEVSNETNAIKRARTKTCVKGTSMIESRFSTKGISTKYVHKNYCVSIR